jgi:AcrR family transcriptional regulator
VLSIRNINLGFETAASPRLSSLEVAPLPDHLISTRVGKERLPKAVLEEHQRNRVLDAATHVFAERGYNSTTVDDLVAASRIGVGSFYALFAGKEDCFLILLDRVVEDARERVGSAAPEGAPWAVRASAGLRELLEIVAEEADRARIVLVEAPTAGPAGEARYARVTEEVAAVLREGRSADSGGRGLPESFEEGTIGGFAWLFGELLSSGEQVDADTLFQELESIGIEPYIGRAA